MQRTISRENRDLNQEKSQQKSANKDGLIKHWKSKAHKLADLVFKQELQKRDLQKEIDILKDAQNMTQDAQEIATLKAELLSTKEKLLQQAEDLVKREDLLKQAAGAARKEVLELQKLNAELQNEVDRLIEENKALSEEAKKTVSNTTPLKEATSKLQEPSASPFFTCYTSPGKMPHVDIATLQSMLRQRDGELKVLKEDNAAKQEELLHSLQSLQAAQKRAEDLRCQNTSLNSQIDILREALRQNDADVEEDMLGNMEQLKDIQDALQAREAECTRLNEVINESTNQLARLRSEIQSRVDEVAVLRSVLRERDARVQELEGKIEELQSRCVALQDQLAASDNDEGECGRTLEFDTVVEEETSVSVCSSQEVGDLDVCAGVSSRDDVVLNLDDITSAGTTEHVETRNTANIKTNQGPRVAGVMWKSIILTRLIVTAFCLLHSVASSKKK